jgi:uncharacterized phage-associated protein
LGDKETVSISLNFDYKKAAQALNYFAVAEGGRISQLKALKLVYCADRYHLRKYGRPITNDDYWAMKLGPVPSGTRDISLLNSEYLDERELSYAADYISSDGYALISKKPVDNMLFSESDVEALRFSWEVFGQLVRFDIADITHLYPEWNKHKEALEINSRVHMYLEDFLQDPESDVNKCYELSDEMKKERLEQLKELAEVAGLWS